MLKIEKTVFISYRRTNVFHALAIHQNLTHHGYDVFFYYESIGAGDFEQIILKSIESRAHFVVILTPSALQRCKEPSDWLRREIEHALMHKRNIIPLTFEGFDFKDMVRFLPDHIAATISRYNALSVPSAYFDEAMTKLTKRLNIEVDTVLHPPSTAVQTEEVRQQRVIAAEPNISENKLKAGAYYELAHAYVQDRYFETARSVCDEVLRLAPDYGEAYSLRGYVKTMSDDFLNAGEDIEQAIRLNPDYPELYILRASHRMDIGNHVGAMADYSEAIRLKPDYAAAYNSRGTMKADKDDEGAITDYDEAIRLDPEAYYAYYNRADAKSRLGDYDGAIADIERILYLKPDDASGTYSLRGHLKRAKGDYDGAIADYSQALHLKPNSVIAYMFCNNRGEVKFLNGDYDGAIADFDQAVHLNPDYSPPYYNRGLAREKKCDYQGAIDDLSMYLKVGYVSDRAKIREMIHDLEKLL